MIGLGTPISTAVKIMSPSDRAYKNTKRLRRSGGELRPPLQDVARWIESTYGVEVLNVVYEPRGGLRLTIVLASADDCQEVGGRAQTNFQEINQRFGAAITKRLFRKPKTDQLQVCYSDFAKAALEEACDRFGSEGCEQLRTRLQDDQLWTIRQLPGHTVTFFVYTDRQARAAEESGILERYRQEYLNAVEPYYGFGYLPKCSIHATCDSKENFDDNYEGDWLAYYR